jgi:hypothetical protein
MCVTMQELSQHSGVALHHIAQLYGHGLMYHATLLISKGGVPIMRLLSAGASLADLLAGESGICRTFAYMLTYGVMWLQG